MDEPLAALLQGCFSFHKLIHNRNLNRRKMLLASAAVSQSRKARSNFPGKEQAFSVHPSSGSSYAGVLRVSLGCGFEWLRLAWTRSVVFRVAITLTPQFLSVACRGFFMNSAIGSGWAGSAWGARGVASSHSALKHCSQRGTPSESEVVAGPQPPSQSSTSSGSAVGARRLRASALSASISCSSASSAVPSVHASSAKSPMCASSNLLISKCVAHLLCLS